MINNVKSEVTTFVYKANKYVDYAELTNFQTNLPNGAYVVDIDFETLIKFDNQNKIYAAESNKSFIKIIDKKNNEVINITSGIIRAERRS